MVTGKPFFTAEQINKRVKELADRISADYEGKNLLAVGILKGAFMFYADLVRMIQVPLTIDFITASSYLRTISTEKVSIHCEIREDVRGKDVLLIEDIADSGITLNYIRERILAASPNSVRICVFLNKCSRRVVDVPLDYIGFEIPNEYVVGYGLDYDNKFRNLPYISFFRKTTDEV